jgi:hypothetical protein
MLEMPGATLGLMIADDCRRSRPLGLGSWTDQIGRQHALVAAKNWVRNKCCMQGQLTSSLTTQSTRLTLSEGPSTLDAIQARNGNGEQEKAMTRGISTCRSLAARHKGFCQFRVRCKVAKVGVEGDEVRWQARLRPNWTSGDSAVEARMTRQDGQRIEAETWSRRR